MNKNIVIGVLVVLTLVLGGFILTKKTPSFAGMPFLETQYFRQGAAIGGRATVLKKVYTGTCTLVSNSSITATSTGTGTCATPGTIAGDQVFISLATTTTKQSANFIPLGTVAGTDSTTVRLFNLTGGNLVPASVNGFGSSTQYTVYRD